MPARLFILTPFESLRRCRAMRSFRLSLEVAVRARLIICSFIILISFILLIILHPYTFIRRYAQEILFMPSDFIFEDAASENMLERLFISAFYDILCLR